MEPYGQHVHAGYPVRSNGLVLSFEEQAEKSPKPWQGDAWLGTTGRQSAEKPES